MSKALRKVVYGTPTDKCAITVRLGIENGIFADEGLDMSVRVVFGGPQIAASYDSGEIEIGEMGSPPAINAIAEGKRFKIVGSGVRQKAHMFFAVRKGIKSYRELEGKRIGMLGIGSCPDWIMQKILRSEGIDPQLVEFVPLLQDYPRVIELIAEGKIDACLAVEPNVSMGEARGIVDFWTAAFVEPYLPDYQWIVHIARDELIRRDPELIRTVLRGCRRSAHYAAEHVNEWATLGAKLYGTTDAVMRAAIDRELPHFQLDGQIDMKGLQQSVDLQFELGGIPRRMKADEFVDLRFQPVPEEALASLQS
jgi:ABC-type nitrate/sulfonate/bicarbonate transport system substrate-binding protein